MGRLSIPEYAMRIADVASLRSEDPYRKVGAVALDHHNRVIGTGYNGLAPGVDVDEDFWLDRDKRRKYMIHAEVNLCSLFRRGDAKIVAVTFKPCTSCFKMLCAYGIKEIYYREEYERDVDVNEVAKLFNVVLSKVDGISQEIKRRNSSGVVQAHASMASS